MAQDRVKAINKSMPALARGKVGDVLNDLITQFNHLLKSINTVCLAAAGLVIKAASSPMVKAGAPVIANVNGVLARRPANTDMSVLAGTLATAKSAAWAFYIDASGAISTSTKTADAATHDAAILLLPPLPDNKAQIGFVVIDNATGANFVGNTTALDVANLTVTYYNTPGPFLLASDTASAAITAIENR